MKIHVKYSNNKHKKRINSEVPNIKKVMAILAIICLSISVVPSQRDIFAANKTYGKRENPSYSFVNKDGAIDSSFGDKANVEKNFGISPLEKNGTDKESDSGTAMPKELFGKKVLKARAYGDKSIWFDGTLGLGNNSLVKNATNQEKIVNQWTNSVVSPTSAGGDGKYKLRGWYNIDTGKYYKAGESVDATRNSVYYADWVQADYNIGKSQHHSLVQNQPDTGSFVRTDVFDYNEIFNAKHGAKIDGNIHFQNGWNSSHTETWRDDQTNNLIFTNWYNWSVTDDNSRSLGFPKDAQTKRNAYSSENNGYNITDGIVNKKNDYFIKELFTPLSIPGREYLGKGNKLFQYDSDNTTGGRGFGTGYYYYDSDHNGIDYNKEKQRFYVYDQKQYIQNENKDGNSWVANSDRTTGFMPLEPMKNGDVMEKSGQTNYWFGMKTEVDFFLPDDTGKPGGNYTPQNKPMRFYFSGDDDVWVFVDDVKVLDLGGIHKRVSGDINFSTGEINYKKAGSTHLNGENLKTDTQTLKQIKSGNHKLTIYYLERGSSKSNCSIYFNLAPRYQLNLEKTDGNNGQLLKGAEFSIYADKNCSIPARLWDNEADCKADKPTKNVFTTGNDGKLSCYGLMANRTYYIKETEAPALYPSVADKVIKLKMDAAGNAFIVNSNELNGLVSLGEAQGDQKIQLNVQNKKPPKTSVEVEKKWYKDDGTIMTGNTPDKVEVELYRSTTKPGGGSGGSTPGTPNSKVPVNFTSQYFDNPYVLEPSNGYNMDIGYLEDGDRNLSTVVTSGGTIDFTVKVKGNNAGVYAVTANGKVVEPVSSSNPCAENCYIAGNWGHHPDRNVKYSIPINEATDIKVTLIGYLEYVGSKPLVSATMNIQDVVVNEPANPGGSGGSQPSNQMGEIPEDAELVKEPSGIENPAILNIGNNWHKIWKNLTTQNSEGKPYYYYVKEKPVTGFSTSYSDNGVINGKITVTNLKIREIFLKKKWLNVDGSEMKDKDKPDIDIDAILIQHDNNTNSNKEIPVKLTKGNSWKKHWWCDSKELGEIKGHTYKYTVKEISEIEGYTTTYENNNGITEGEIAIKNKLKPYNLPSTGGIGTYIFAIVGSFLVALSLLLVVRRIKLNKANWERR